jgi:hypothetical protein
MVVRESRASAGFEVGIGLAAIATNSDGCAWGANVSGRGGAGKGDSRSDGQDAHDGEGAIGLKADVALVWVLMLHEM